MENLSDLTGLDRQQFRQVIQNAKKEEAEHIKLREKQASEAAAWVLSLDDNDNDPNELQVLPGYADVLADFRSNATLRDAEEEAKRRTKHSRELLKHLKKISAQAILEQYQGLGAYQTFQ